MVRRALVLVLLAFVASACSGGDDDGGEPADRESTSTSGDASEMSTSTSTPTSAPPPEAIALERLLLAEVLPGFRSADDDDRFVTGAMDLETAAGQESDVEAERAHLQTRKFEGGYAGAWTDSGGDVVLVTLYRFADARAASFYLADGREDLLARNVQPFDVPQLPDAFGFTDVDDSGDVPFTAQVVAFTRGDVYALVIVGSNQSSRTADDARQVAAAQARRLTDRSSTSG